MFLYVWLQILLFVNRPYVRVVLVNVKYNESKSYSKTLESKSYLIFR
jgi:hypothetical protein